MQHVPIYDPARQRLHEFVMGDASEEPLDRLPTTTLLGIRSK
jgi:hypothetical protein